MSKKNKDKQGLKLIPHPFSGIDPDLLKRELDKVSKGKVEVFPQKLSAILELLKEYDPETVLAIITSYGLSQYATDTSVKANTGYLSQFNQHHAELLQALILSLPLPEHGKKLPSAEIIHSIFELLFEVTDAFHMRRMTGIINESDEQKQREMHLQELMRIHTQAVRNWGHYSEVVETSRQLYKFIKDRSPAWNGWLPTDAITIFDYLLTEIEKRSTARFQLLKQIFRSRKVSKVIKEYCRLLVNDKDEALKLRKMAKDQNWNLENTRAILLSHMDLGLRGNFTFQISKIADDNKLNPETCAQVIDDLSLKYGDLKSSNIDFFFLDNPIWNAPIVKKCDDFIFIPMPQLFFSFVLSIFSQFDRFEKEIIKHKPKFLEAKVTQIVTDYGDYDQNLSGYIWHEGTTKWENDHVVRFDNNLLLIEDKAGHLSPPALRGALDSAKRHAQDILGEGSIQSSRLENALCASNDCEFNELEDVKEHINQFHRVVLTFHDLHPLTLHLPDMKEVGWVSEEFDFAHSMHFTDFNCLLDILNNPIFLFHYLRERKRLRDNQHIRGDELDLLALYIQTGFNFHTLEQENMSLIATGLSQSIDQYYEGKRLGLPVSKPTPKIAPLWKSIIGQLYERKFNGYIDIGIDLLSSGSPEEQLKFQKQFYQIEASVRDSWQTPNHVNAAILVPPDNSKAAVIFFAFPNQRYDERQADAENLASQVFEQDDVKRCVVIGRNIDKPEDAYSFIYVLTT